MKNINHNILYRTLATTLNIFKSDVFFALAEMTLMVIFYIWFAIEFFILGEPIRKVIIGFVLWLILVFAIFVIHLLANYLIH